MQVSKSLTCRTRGTLRQDVVTKSCSLGPCSSEMMPTSVLWRAFRNYERFPLGQRGRYQPDCDMCKVQKPASADGVTSEIASPILKGAHRFGNNICRRSDIQTSVFSPTRVCWLQQDNVEPNSARLSKACRFTERLGSWQDCNPAAAD